MKQRLVGVIVLGCLAVIFIPILLDGSGVSSPDIESGVPEPPAVPDVPEVEPLRPEILADDPQALAPETAGDAAEQEPADDTPSLQGAGSPEDAEAGDGPRLDDRGMPEAWSVRLASFTRKDNAEALVGRLLQNDYKGFSRPVDTSRGQMTAVYVGPVLTRDEAEALRRDLEEEYGLQGIIVQFGIEELDQ